MKYNAARERNPFCERNLQIYAQRKAGRTFSEMARELSISPGRVRQVYKIEERRARAKWDRR